MQTEQVTRIVLWLAGAVVSVNIALALFVLVRRLLHARYFALKDEARRLLEPTIRKIASGEIAADAGLFATASSRPQRDALEDLLLAQLDGPQRTTITVLLQQLAYVDGWAVTAFGLRNAAKLKSASPSTAVVRLPKRQAWRIFAVPRAAAVKKLGALASDSAIAWLRVALHDPSPLVIRTAITCLGHVDTQDAVPLLLEQLTAAVDGNSGISIRSIKAALVRHPVSAIEHFVPLLSHDNARLRFLVVDTMREICTEEARKAAAPALPQSVIKALVEKCAQDTSADVRARTAAVVSFARDEQATATLTRLMHDENQFVRLHGVRSCADAYYEPLLPHVAERITDPFWRVREAAVRATFAFGRHGLDTLLELLSTTGDLFAREQIVEELQRNGTLLKMIRMLDQPAECQRNLQVLKKLVAMEKTAVIRNAAQSMPNPVVRGILQDLLRTSKKTAIQPGLTTDARITVATAAPTSHD